VVAAKLCKASEGQGCSHIPSDMEVWGILTVSLGFLLPPLWVSPYSVLDNLTCAHGHVVFSNWSTLSQSLLLQTFLPSRRAEVFFPCFWLQLWQRSYPHRLCIESRDLWY
jgi:hypothetical protein